LATLAVGILLAWRNSTPAYKRYLSPPLPDGSRYTFLYPVNSRVNEIGGHSTDGASMDGARSYMDGVRVDSKVEKKTFLTQFLALLGMQKPSQRFGILVSLLAPSKPGDLHRKRRDEWSTEKGVHYHSMYLPAASAGLVLELLNWEVSPPPALFRQTDAVVSSSFRLLPPGTSPPAP
jgi:hypothetical protein